jgi:hypothetical protein
LNLLTTESIRAKVLKHLIALNLMLLAEDVHAVIVILSSLIVDLIPTLYDALLYCASHMERSFAIPKVALNAGAIFSSKPADAAIEIVEIFVDFSANRRCVFVGFDSANRIFHLFFVEPYRLVIVDAANVVPSSSLDLYYCSFEVRTQLTLHLLNFEPV